MQQVALLVALAVASMATVAAMVRFSRAVLQREDNPAQWGFLYAGAWVVVLGILATFLGQDLQRNLVVFIAIPAGIIVLHALLLRLSMAMRDAPPPRPVPRPPFAAEEEEEEEEEFGTPTAHEPPLPVRAFFVAAWAARWAVGVFLCIVVIVIGESLPPLHAMDARLAPHRTVIGYVLGSIAAAAFAAFMIGAVAGRRFGIAGAVVLLVAAALLGIVFAPPGVKLIVILTAGYAAVRTIAGFIRRSAR